MKRVVFWGKRVALFVVVVLFLVFYFIDPVDHYKKAQLTTLEKEAKQLRDLEEQLQLEDSDKRLDNGRSRLNSLLFRANSRMDELIRAEKAAKLNTDPEFARIERQIAETKARIAEELRSTAGKREKRKHVRKQLRDVYRRMRQLIARIQDVDLNE